MAKNKWRAISLLKAKAFLFSSFILLTLGSCGTEKKEEPVYTLPENALELLAGREAKTWKLAKRTNDKMRVNMNNCTLSFRQTFNRKGGFSDNNSENPDCGPSLQGHWALVNDSEGRPHLSLSGELVPSLFKVKEGSNTKYFRIVTLSDSLFVYRFTHQLFSNETTIIEDTLIPENAPEGDRNFHW